MTHSARTARVPLILNRAVLALTSATLVAVGTGVAFVPQAFYGAYGIPLADGATLLGELRATGVTLLLLGALVGSGVVTARLAPTAALVGTITMLAHAAGRLLSWVADGGLAPGLLGAGIAELGLGTACLWVVQRPATTRQDGSSSSSR